ncbi:uncharacterized protein P884DRAFT_273371 [Thermothelomyces heterothallicus CBS 202.75]|uniref:uncharacterized protein n=1 Tax=Thermothelomyces heterothallicus CBS 202.75 TaxID=1149848 RepID=UPI0037433258
MYTNFNVTTNVHLGLLVPPDTTSADRQWRSVLLYTIPHYAFGQVGGWEAMTAYIFFPRLFKDVTRQAKPLDLTILSAEQFSLWTDVLRQAVAYLTSAPTEQAARFSSSDNINPRRQIVGHYLSAHTTQRLTDIISQLFGDFVFYFAYKNTKLQFMGSRTPDGGTPYDSSFLSVSQKFLEHWERCFDDNFLDPTRVFVDLGKQTFLYRNCCLQAAVDDREQWLAKHDSEHYAVWPSAGYSPTKQPLAKPGPIAKAGPGSPSERSLAKPGPTAKAGPGSPLERSLAKPGPIAKAGPGSPSERSLD